MLRAAKRWYNDGEANTIDPQRARDGTQVSTRENSRYTIPLCGTVPAPTTTGMFGTGLRRSRGDKTGAQKANYKRPILHRVQAGEKGGKESVRFVDGRVIVRRYSAGVNRES